MSNNWIKKNPILLTVLGLNVLGLTACSSSGNNEMADDASYEAYDASEEGSSESKIGEYDMDAPAEGMSSDEYQEKQTPVLRTNNSGKAYRSSRFPSIASQPFDKNGHLLNAYVFVRGEKSWEELSSLLYGRSDRASLLAEWNSAQSVEAGSVVYYSSPFRPDDTTNLKSFEEDFGLTYESVVVEPGDSLSAIAQKTYGDINAWREIASLNQSALRSPDQIEIGQTVQLGNFDRATLSLLQAASAKAQAEAEAELLQSAQDQQIAQTEQLTQEPQDPDEGVGAQAPPEEMIEEPIAEYESPIEDSAIVEASSDDTAQAEVSNQEANTDEDIVPYVDIVVALVALLAIAGGIVFYIRKKQGNTPSATDLLSFGRKKTGTDDE